MAARNELTCQELVELVTRYIEDDLPSEEVARFEAHLAICQGCVNYLDQMRQTIRVVGTLREENIPPEATSRLLSVFRDWKRGA